MNNFVRHAAHDSRAALSYALANHLLCQEFCVWSPDGASTTFKMLSVNPSWPEPQKDMVTPTATILDTEGAVQVPQGFAPAPMEDTWNVFAPNTVLWVVGESHNEFQIDFWLSNEPDREAVSASLSSMFNPSVDYRGLRLDLGDLYFNRVGRYTLHRWERVDTENSIFPRERRLSVRLLAETDEVQLRSAQIASFNVRAAVTAENTGDP